MPISIAKVNLSLPQTVRNRDRLQDNNTQLLRGWLVSWVLGIGFWVLGFGF
jgi:hypothetical protein